MLLRHQVKLHGQLRTPSFKSHVTGLTRTPGESTEGETHLNLPGDGRAKTGRPGPAPPAAWNAPVPDGEVGAPGRLRAAGWSEAPVTGTGHSPGLEAQSSHLKTPGQPHP